MFNIRFELIGVGISDVDCSSNVFFGFRHELLEKRIMLAFDDGEVAVSVFWE